MKDDFLRIDIQLLLCRYGRQKVLSALADIESCDAEKLEDSLRKLRARKDATKKRATRKTLVSSLDDLADPPEKIAVLRPFIVAYENGTLFPTLKSAQRFLESRGVPVLSMKSRKAAGPSVLRALSRMSEPELQELEHSISGDGQSDFSLLSKAILRTGDRD